jgi:hypothetical protein
LPLNPTTGGSRGQAIGGHAPKVTKVAFCCACVHVRNVGIPIQNTKLCDEDSPKAWYNALNAVIIIPFSCITYGSPRLCRSCAHYTVFSCPECGPLNMRPVERRNLLTEIGWLSMQACRSFHAQSGQLSVTLYISLFASMQSMQAYAVIGSSPVLQKRVSTLEARSHFRSR